ncbi:MAG: outer membrane beta-barrel protein [Lacunisphaera sp.]
MKNIKRFALVGALAPALAFAVYAPIPEQEQGKALTYRLGASAYYDSNIFGAAAGAIDSMVWNVNGKIAFNGSIDDQTFASASYFISNDYVEDRPGDKNLTNQSFAARLAHSFSPATNIDVSGAYDVVKNPQSLQAGIPLNTDQSYDRAEADARFTTALGKKGGIVAKYRYIDYAYDNDILAAELDHAENLLGLELSYALLPETKLVGEYRYQVIDYDHNGAFKDKTSNFLMAGFDYNPGKQLIVSARGGFENRNRDSQPDVTAPYVELSTRYTYTEDSFVSAGYSYTLEEPSDTIRFNDSEVNRFFVNVQHRLSGAFTASGSITYEPSKLQGRAPQADIDESTLRFGVGISWQPTKNLTVSGTYDLDDIQSDDSSREQNRDRLGISATYTF